MFLTIILLTNKNYNDIMILSINRRRENKKFLQFFKEREEKIDKKLIGFRKLSNLY